MSRVVDDCDLAAYFPVGLRTAFRQGLRMQINSSRLNLERGMQRCIVGRSRTFWTVAAANLLWASAAAAQFPGQPAASTPAASQASKSGEGKPAIIERAPLILRDSSQFQIPLKLEAANSIHVAARIDGVVATVLAKLGDRIQSQAEVARLESQERQLELARAQAGLRAAQAERSANSGAAAAVAEARVALSRLRFKA